MEIGFISRHSIHVKLTGIKEFNCADRGPESNQAVAPVCDGCDVDTAIQKVSEFREGFTSDVKTQSERGKKVKTYAPTSMLPCRPLPGSSVPTST